MSRRRIFISYRRSDSAGTAGLLRKTLADALGMDRVFQDVVGIEPGARFDESIKDQIRQAVVLAVIGRDWLSAANEFYQRRIDFDDDWVHQELALALSSEETTVIPVLVDGATMPPSEALPLALRSLPIRNAIVLHHDAFDESATRLIDRLRQLLNDNGRTSAPTETHLPLVTMNEIREVLRQELARFTKQQAAFYSIASMVGEVSGLLPAGPEWEEKLVDESTLGVFIAKLRWRLVADVETYLGAVLRDRFTLTTDRGVWIGFAVRSDIYPGSFDQHDEYLADVIVRKGCILLRPDNRGRVDSIVVVASVREGHNVGVTTTAASSILLQLGESLGNVDPFQYH